MLTLTRTTTGTAAASLGAGIVTNLESAGGTTRLASRQATTYSTATDAAEVSNIEFYAMSAGALALKATITGATGVLVPTTSKFAFGTVATQSAYLQANGSTGYMVLSAASTSVASLRFDATAVSSGVKNWFQFNGANSTGQTASTEVSGVLFSIGNTRTWSTGAIASQREFYIKLPTYAFAAASTITTAATLAVEGAPAAGTNATITNGYSAWFGAKIRIDAAAAISGAVGPATLAATTAGATGPQTAAQNEWIRIDTENGARFVPAWA
jgi:hypothetical protein